MQRVAPPIEAQVWPASRGISISWDKLQDGSILITEAVIWKCHSCEYRGMNARAGRDDLRITYASELGSRPGGYFILRNARIQKPIASAPIRIELSVRHNWAFLWISRSHLFTIDYE